MAGVNVTAACPAIGIEAHAGQREPVHHWVRFGVRGDSGNANLVERLRGDSALDHFEAPVACRWIRQIQYVKCMVLNSLQIRFQ